MFFFAETHKKGHSSTSPTYVQIYCGHPVRLQFHTISYHFKSLSFKSSSQFSQSFFLLHFSLYFYFYFFGKCGVPSQKVSSSFFFCNLKFFLVYKNTFKHREFAKAISKRINDMKRAVWSASNYRTSWTVLLKERERKITKTVLKMRSNRIFVLSRRRWSTNFLRN